MTVIARLVLLSALCVLPTLVAAEDSPQPFAWAKGAFPASDEDIQPAPVGAQLPGDLSLLNPEGEVLDLWTVVGAQPLSLLIVYRGGWCPFCTTQLAGLAQQAAALEELGVQLLGLSPDRPEALAKGLAEAETAPPYALLSDPALEVIERFGLGFALDEETIARYEGFGLALAKNSHGQTALPVPALYLINKDGKIVWRHIDPNFRERPDAEVVLEAVRNALAEPTPPAPPQ